MIKLSYEEVLKEVTNTKKQRGKLYRREPKDVVPVEVLLSMVYYKATRAYESTDQRKTRDELIDLINYSLFALEKIPYSGA
jgi:hypothetical protein